MGIAMNGARSNARNALVKAALILGANFVAVSLIAGAIAVLTGSNAFDPGNTSTQLAALVGWLQVSLGATAAAVRSSAGFVHDAEEADDLRREGRALLLGSAALIAAGTSLIVLSLAGPARPVPMGVGLGIALFLNILAAVLVAVRLRGMDELNRGTAREANHLAFVWVFWVGGTWAILAHLEFVAAPAPLDWLTMLGGFGLAAGLIAAARKGAFDTTR